MADYYAILTKAISALPESSGEARRDVYEKARKALVSQLQSFDPPLPPSEITSQRLTLEEAIRKVEAEAARATLGIGRPKQPEKPAAAEPKPETPATTEAAPEKSDKPAETDKPKKAEKPEKPEKTETVETPEPSVSPDETSGKKTDAPPVPTKGVDIFRRAVAEADNLGAATSEASRAAREVLNAAAEDTAGAPTRDQEPDIAPLSSGDDAVADGETADAEPSLSAEPLVGTDTVPGEFDDVDGIYDEGIAKPLSSRTMWMVAAILLLFIFAGVGAFVYSQRDILFAKGEDTAEPEVEEPKIVEINPKPAKEDENGMEPKITDRLPTVGAAPDARPVRTMRVTAPTTTSESSNGSEISEEEPTVIPADDQPPANETVTEAPEPESAETETADSEPAETTPAETPEREVAAVEPVETTPEPQASAQPSESPSGADRDNTVLVGQRAILYEEGGSRGSNKAFIGNVTWKLDEEPVSGGTSTDTVLIARAEIPERGMIIDIKIRPNRDADLPASHSIEIGFDLPNEFSEKGIANVPGLILKTTEEARGDALRGASIRVLDNLFWIALSKIDAEQKNNETLLKDRAWIDIPILYQSEQRAILTLEKGGPGDQAIEEAFKRWNAG